jgi:hypothetical protein
MAHFYAQTEAGVEPRHFVETKTGKNAGKLRPSRVTDARTALKNGERWFPSVTTVLGILDKPGLNNWKVDQHLESAYHFIENGIVFDSADQFYRKVRQHTQERLDEAPQLGTDIHKVIEDYINKGFSLHQDFTATEAKICENVRATLDDYVGLNRKIEPEAYLVNPVHGYAGCLDLRMDEWYIDWKSKKEASKFKPGKMAYDEHRMQLAAYGMCDKVHDLSHLKFANGFICLETGEIDFHIHETDEIERAWNMFYHANEFYKVSKYNATGDA